MPHPWEIEPSYLDFEADGLKCAMRRHQHGHWCGYVAVPPTHPWFGLPNNALIKPTKAMLQNRTFQDTGPINVFLHAMSGKDANEEMTIGLALSVHGGISWANDRLPEEKPDGNFWFGFDCAHAGDLSPKVIEIAPPHLRCLFLFDAVYRDQAYVIAECQNLAAQLARI